MKQYIFQFCLILEINIDILYKDHMFFFFLIYYDIPHIKVKLNTIKPKIEMEPMSFTD